DRKPAAAVLQRQYLSAGIRHAGAIHIRESEDRPLEQYSGSRFIAAGHLARRFFLPGRPDIRLVRGTARTPRRRPLRAVSYIHSLRADIVPPTSRTRLASHRGMGQTPATENTTPGFG